MTNRWGGGTTDGDRRAVDRAAAFISEARHHLLATTRLVTTASSSSLSEVFAGFGRAISTGTLTQAAMDSIVKRRSGWPLPDFDSDCQLARKPVQTLVIRA